MTLTDPMHSVLDLLVAESGLPKQQIKQAMHKGAFWRSRGKQAQRIRRVPKKPKVGDAFHLYYDEKVLTEEPPEAQLIADEGAYSVWYKPYGMRSQGSKWGDHCALYRWVECNLSPERPAFLVHRLDRAATGLILVAHQKKAASSLTQLFEQRQIGKRYRVIVGGRFSEYSGAWGTQRTFNSDIDGKTAISHVRCLDYDESHDRSLLDVFIETGRKHQIRRHLSEAGFPVVGDRLYGGSSDINLQLTAYSLTFTCPISGGERAYCLPSELLPTL